MNTVTQHFWPDFYDQRGIGSPKVSLSKSPFFWDLEFLNGNGCKSVTAEKKGHVLFEVIFTHHVSSIFWIFGWLAWDKAQCKLTRTENAFEVTKIIVSVQMSLIQVRLWDKFLLESPAIVTCRATTNRRSWKVSYFKQNLLNFRRFVWSTNLITQANSYICFRTMFK